MLHVKFQRISTGVVHQNLMSMERPLSSSWPLALDEDDDDGRLSTNSLDRYKENKRTFDVQKTDGLDLELLKMAAL